MYGYLNWKLHNIALHKNESLHVVDKRVYKNIFLIMLAFVSSVSQSQRKPQPHDY